MTAARGRPHNVALSEVPVNAGCVPFGWEVIVSKTTNSADVSIVGEETIASEAVPRGRVVEPGRRKPDPQKHGWRPFRSSLGGFNAPLNMTRAHIA
jgi:hypothetical protein